MATFRIRGASRAFTHQLVRHRIASFSQQSQRYVDERGFNYIIPPEIANDPDALKLFRDSMDHAEKAYAALRAAGVRKEDARFVLPNACETRDRFFGEFREFMTIYDCPDAQPIGKSGASALTCSERFT
jgi:thymidylate synthase (FAD)